MIDVQCVVLLQVHVDRFTNQLASSTSISCMMMISVVSFFSSDQSKLMFMRRATASV